MKGAGDPAVDNIRRAGQQQHPKGPQVILRFKQVDDQRYERQTHKTQQIWQREDTVRVHMLRPLHLLAFLLTQGKSLLQDHLFLFYNIDREYQLNINGK